MNNKDDMGTAIIYSIIAYIRVIMTDLELINVTSKQRNNYIYA